MSARTAGSIGGRPGRPVRREVHFLRTSSRCQRRRVTGGTRKVTGALTRDDPTRRCEEDPIDDTELERARRPLQHAKLMAEDEDLEVLASVVSALLATADEETDEGADDEVEEGQHRPIVPGRSEHESGFPTPTGHGRRGSRRSVFGEDDGERQIGTVGGLVGSGLTVDLAVPVQA